MPVVSNFQLNDSWGYYNLIFDIPDVSVIYILIVVAFGFIVYWERFIYRADSIIRFKFDYPSTPLTIIDGYQHKYGIMQPALVGLEDKACLRLGEHPAVVRDVRAMGGPQKPRETGSRGRCRLRPMVHGPDLSHFVKGHTQASTSLLRLGGGGAPGPRLIFSVKLYMSIFSRPMRKIACG